MSECSASRKSQSFEIRTAAADLAKDRPHPEHVSNGDEDRFRNCEDGQPTLIGSFTKGMPHNRGNGLLTNPCDYDLFVHAFNTGRPDDIMAVPLGPNEEDGGKFHSGMAQSAKTTVRAWESMAAGLEFDLQGPDAQAVTMPPAPSITSAEHSFEMSEIYWMALLRDVAFNEFEGNELVCDAVRSLNSHPWINNPHHCHELSEAEQGRLRAELTECNIFRGQLPGDHEGPYLSQFLVVGTPAHGNAGGIETGMIQYGSMRMDQRVRVAQPGLDYMTTYQAWLDVQNGADFRRRELYTDEGPQYRFMTTPRDLATYVHYDALYEAYLNACLILLEIGAPFDKGLPFTRPDVEDHQTGFATFGGPHILTLVTEVATRALKAVRFQKFNTHRRLRPEATAWLIDSVKRAHDTPAFADAEELASRIDEDLLAKIYDHNASLNSTVQDGGIDRCADFDPWTDDCRSSGNYLLPMPFTEGSPMHPSYGAGHATVAGACITVLKAFFDTSFELPFAFAPNNDGTELVSVDLEKPLTVEGELNKVCSNISIGRDWAGVHYYSDYIESVKLGELIAIGILQEQKLTYNEEFSMTIPLIDGETTITI